MDVKSPRSRSPSPARSRSSSAGEHQLAFNAFGNSGRTGSGDHDQIRKGTSAFNALVTKGGRSLEEATKSEMSIMEGTRKATVYRHRSGSLTEFHSDGSGGSHNAYHASVTDKRVYRRRS